ncbi:MAG: Bro-N domain-containing protein [Candidatus Kapabacteria bacterium]|nr:Bro-N domain-containing protein [Candidatus Kapabacteria bacterium]
MQLVVFKYQNTEENMLNEIKTVEINDEIWFVATDVCKALEIVNVPDAVSRLDDDEKLLSVVPIAGQEHRVTLISESGLYNLIFKSRKSSAQQFRKWITKEVIPSIRKKGYYGKIDRSQLPNFITRYKDNYHKLPANYFSVISEMFARLYIEFEKIGYQIPDRGQDGKQMMPDISVGRGFAKYLRDIESEFYDQHKTYNHTFPDGKEVDANMYHIDAIPVFIRYIHEKWIPENALNYFKYRDPLALEYLPKLLKE